MGPRILVVDDEETICVLLDRVLQKEGYAVRKVSCGIDALAAMVREKPDLIILDFNLPDLSGEHIYQRLRKDARMRDIPILIITGRPVEGLLVRCLNGGADAFLAKPFDMPELLALIRALLRRSTVYLEPEGAIEKGGIAIQSGERSVLLNGIPLKHLSPKEFDVLKELVSQSPHVVAKHELAAKVWGAPIEHLHPRTLDVHMRRIRKKIGVKGARCLKTIPAIGYQWLPEVTV